MPLYKKAISFTSEDLDNMTMQDCEEVLLALRYLAFREDDPQKKEHFLERIKVVEARIAASRQQLS